MSDTPSTPLPVAAPLGQGDYVVQQGDCMNSIALENGFFWNSLWNLDENKDLREKRQNPNALLPGDRVTIPPLRQRSEECKSGQRYRFKRKGEPTKLILVMALPDGRPRTNIKYRVIIDDTIEHEGVTDDKGKVEIRIVGSAKKGVLFFDLDQPEPEEYELNLGLLDPISSISGIQARLNALGYTCGPVNGELNEQTQSALNDFQEANKISPSGQITQKTLDVLFDLYGS